MLCNLSAKENGHSLYVQCPFTTTHDNDIIAILPFMFYTWCKLYIVSKYMMISGVLNSHNWKTGKSMILHFEHGKLKPCLRKFPRRQEELSKWPIFLRWIYICCIITCLQILHNNNCWRLLGDRDTGHSPQFGDILQTFLLLLLRPFTQSIKD